jgi:curved DNA-binding protein CbpA
MQNLYQVLGVDKAARIPIIKKAYRDKALLAHPDKGGDAAKMSLLTTAYQTLVDPVKRRQFDNEWEIYNVSNDEEFSSLLSGHLPTAGISFSASFRKDHAELVNKYQKNPLVKGSPVNYFKPFHSKLYSSSNKENVFYSDIFSFIKNESFFETKLNIKFLTPEKAIELFLKFLQGDYSGNTLKELEREFARKIINMEINPSYYSQDLALFSGIHEILSLAVNETDPDHTLLFSLQKITDYAALTAEQTMVYFATLFQSKYFRNLFSQALHLYWLKDESALDTDRLKMLDGQSAAEKLIERFKLKLSENRTAGKSNEQLAKLLQYTRLLSKLEKDLHKSPYVTYTERAAFYRNKAFHLLDWMPALIGLSGQMIIVNTVMQAAISFQKASLQETNPVLQMADEKIATQLYLLAMQIGRRATPDVELYIQVQGLKFLLSCQYIDSELEELITAFQHHSLLVADMFPFFQPLQSNIEFVSQEDQTILLMRQLLHALIDMADKAKEEGSEIKIDHTYVRVFYQAYEACLKNWYQKQYQPEVEKAFRSRLMQELLESKKWENLDLDYNLNAPWAMKEVLDEDGWTQSHQTLALSKKANIPTYRTVHGLEVNYKTGKLGFILDYCEAKEPDFNRLLTLYDLDELFQNQMTSAFFSLDPVDPDMPYHPFNEMRFAPSTLYHSQLLHTMLLTDYVLKFLTVGQEVQRRGPYDFRPLDEITKKLPAYLKKIIDDFHESNHKEAVHRFWIESEAVPYAIDDKELNTNGNVLFAFGDIKMIVKHHRMVRDVDGNLVDKEGEGEGWDCYVLTPKQLRELQTGKRVIADPALLVIQETSEVIFWEEQKVEQRCVLEADKHHLVRISKRKRNEQEKVLIDDSESLHQIYRITRKAASKTGMQHRFSPEFIFAQEFTAHYNEFAIYFHEFGRLRELSKATVLVNIMASQRETNEKNMQCNRNYLKEKILWGKEEHRYWKETEQELKILVRKNIIDNFNEWRQKLSKEKIQQKRKTLLNELRQKIGSLTFTANSPEVKEACQKIHDSTRCDFIAKQGQRKWNESVSKTIWNKIKLEIPTFILKLSTDKRAACLTQLKELFKTELSGLSSWQPTQLLNKFLDGDDKPLIKALVEYDSQQVAKKIKEVYPEHTLESLDSALNNTLSNIDAIVEEETKKALEQHKQHLREKITEGQKLENSFIELKFGSNKSDVDLKESCLWIPASIRHEVDTGHTRAIYGGVRVSGIGRFINPNTEAILSRQTTFAARQLWHNKLVGDAFRDMLAHGLRQHGLEVEKEVSKRTPYGTRYIDIEVWRNGICLGGIEVKSGNPPPNIAQQAKDAWLLRENNYRVNMVRYPYP